MTKAKDADVTVTLLPSQDPPFKIGSPLLQGSKLVFKNQNFPGFMISFNLEDPENSGYLFPDDPKKAFSAKQYQGTPSCPAQGASWSELDPVEVTNSNRTLRVRNYNQQIADFGYSLFVTKDGQGGPFLQLDPIGQNQNGPTMSEGGGWGWGTYAAIAVGIAAIGFALYELGVFGAR
jgi:hypothetical protein